MIATMKRTKKDTEKTVKPAKARSPVLNLRLGEERERRIANFIASQVVPPDKTAVVLKALDDFLDRVEPVQ
jgi:hypothetical protein